MKTDLLNKGIQALAIGAWEEARESLERALQSEESAEVLEHLAWACWWLNDCPAVFQYRSRAYSLFLEKNDRLGASRTASWLGLDYLEMNGEFAIANGWFQRAENLLDGMGDSWELGHVKLLKANLSFRIDKDVDRALQLIEETLILSKAMDKIEVRMMAEALKGFILVTEGRVSEGMVLLDEASVLALSAEAKDIKLITTACCFLIDACDRVRDYERAGQWCGKVKEICKRWRHRVVFATCRNQYAGVLIWNGAWMEAEAELLAASEELTKFRPQMTGGSVVRLADLRRRQGRWEEAAQLFDNVRSHSLKPLGCAWLLFDQGEYVPAFNIAERYLRQIPEHEKTERIAGVELMLNICAQLGRIDQAEAFLQELKEISSIVQTPPLIAAYLNAQGIVNLATERYIEAKENFEDAIDLYDKIISPFESGRARLQLSEALVRLGQMAQAESELYKAMEMFKLLGAAKDTEKTKNRIRNLSKSDAADAMPKEVSGFTGRELEVLRSIAEGLTNEEIAARLFLSVRTVEKHITNIYQKLGISGKSARAFAASYAIKKKLVLT
ncbi:MAG TPA: LuxR C-terminal-related transcriptional regulator [Cyclobacteriaceae bacterium]|nr:LuxR C-terminal-related transcriptional regulator [Cyclobacteriaceae bacterium]